MVEIDGISVDETQLVGFLLPPLFFLVVFGVSWWILLRLSRERQSRGLFLMSLGFLIKTVVDGSWDLFYWSFGGPYYIFSLIRRGMSVAQAGAISSLISWVGYGISLASLITMVALIIYGVTLTTGTATSRILDAPVGS